MDSWNQWPPRHTRLQPRHAGTKTPCWPWALGPSLSLSFFPLLHKHGAGHLRVVCPCPIPGPHSLLGVCNLELGERRLDPARVQPVAYACHATVVPALKRAQVGSGSSRREGEGSPTEGVWLLLARPNSAKTTTVLTAGSGGGGVIASPALHHREQAAYPLAFPPPPSPLSPDPGPALAQPHAHLMDVVSSATSLSEKGVGGGHDVMRSRLGCWNLRRRWVGLGLGGQGMAGRRK